MNFSTHSRTFSPVQDLTEHNMILKNSLSLRDSKKNNFPGGLFGQLRTEHTQKGKALPVSG